jgi:hypothetical protein
MNAQDALRLQQLEDSQAARVCISDYMRLCDSLDSPETVQAIGALFTADACWEGSVNLMPRAWGVIWGGRPSSP